MMTKNNEVRKGCFWGRRMKRDILVSLFCPSLVLPSGHAQFNIVKDRFINYSQTLTEMLPPSPHLFARLLSSTAK